MDQQGVIFEIWKARQLCKEAEIRLERLLYAGVPIGDCDRDQVKILKGKVENLADEIGELRDEMVRSPYALGAKD